MAKPVRLAYVVTHPIQYQAPMLARIAREPGIELRVFFISDISTRGYEDSGFGKKIAWDVPLLRGYEHLFLRVLSGQERLTFWLPIVAGLKKELEAFKPDIVWVHGWVHWALLQAIISARGLGALVALRGEIGTHAENIAGYRKAVKGFFIKWLFSRIDVFLAIGSLNYEYYRSRGISEDRIEMMPYAVDNDYFRNRSLERSEEARELRKKLDIPQDAVVILFCGKMTKRKRALMLMEAYVELLEGRDRNMPVPYLLYVGDGEERQMLEERARRSGCNTVRFVGFVNQRDLPLYYSLGDVFVLPSDREPWGLVVNEAMAAGMPVVVSDEVGCAPDIVRHGVNGYIFDAGSRQSLREVLGLLGTREDLEAMGQESQKIIGRWSFAEDVAAIKRLAERVA